jgi:hypothetical protein
MENFSLNKYRNKNDFDKTTALFIRIFYLKTAEQKKIQIQYYNKT